MSPGLHHNRPIRRPDLSGRVEATDEVENDTKNAGKYEERVDPNQSVKENDTNSTP